MFATLPGMSFLLARVARLLAHHWKRSGAAALAVVVVLGVLAGTVGGAASDDFQIPGTESQQALDLLKAHSPAQAGADATIVFSATEGKITDAPKRAAIERALDEIAQQPGVAAAPSPFDPKAPAVSADERIAQTTIPYTVTQTKLEKEDGLALEEAARTAEGDGVAVALRGQVVDVAAEQEAPVGELVGVALAIVLLTLLFRSAAAMVATLAGALIGVIVGQLLLAALAKPLGLPSFATTIAVMLGLGAGIDYALLIIGRYREQIAKGDSVRDAAAKSAATSGSSVVAAGLIVMVAIAGLLVIGIPLIGKLGIAAALAVAAVVVSALTILPIMIGAFARRLSPKRPEHVLPSEGFRRWGTFVTARPWASIAVGVLVMLVFAAPMTQMRLGQPDDGNQPADRTQRVAYDQLSEGFGPGSNGPFLIAVDIPKGDGASEDQLAALGKAIGADAGVASVLPASVTRDGEAATIIAIPKTAPQDERTSDLLERLRGNVIPAATQGTPLEAYVGGNTAGFEDFSSKVGSRLPLFIAVVIGLSVLLLVAAFRSLWIPLASAVFNLLSVGAAYGAITAVFQQGVGSSLLGIDSGVPIVSFIPVMLFAILFGLSMDYNVFLLSRIQEAYKEGDGPRESVVNGMARIGKVILFAGLIMSAVFTAFVSTPDVTAKMFGLGLGVAILVDVLVVRLVIAPAVVLLLGDRAWWLPGWLDRVLPNVSLEGHLVEGVDDKDPVAAGEERVPATA
ncbi:MAG: drug exporter-like proteinr of the superfamily [Solirubrobacterales bacterium]|jgi:RND superfamily putative drug exporter|nr:drug exporter-like proteinr of the superfamily [Solirubrobacterales bacterium]